MTDDELYLRYGLSVLLLLGCLGCTPVTQFSQNDRETQRHIGYGQDIGTGCLGCLGENADSVERAQEAAQK